ncbi:hypothetical protein BDW62DRAFT_189993 [Aspergillus aurantiobrunneus]
MTASPSFPPLPPRDIDRHYPCNSSSKADDMRSASRVTLISQSPGIPTACALVTRFLVLSLVPALHLIVLVDIEISMYVCIILAWQGWALFQFRPAKER